MNRLASPTALVLAVAVWLGVAIGAALADWAPSKTVDFIVMAGKGGGADKATRFLVDVIGKRKLAPVGFNVINMTEKSGAEALATLKSRAGDPHVLLFTLNSFYTVPLDHPEIGVDIGTFTPVARMGEDVFLLWVNSARTDISSFDDFVNAAKQKGKGWVMAGTGVGAEDNLICDFLNAQYGLTMTYQDKGSGGDVAKELIEKRADSTVNNPSEQSDYYSKGLSKPLVAFTPKRLAAYPLVPALRETGMDFAYVMQRSVAGAPGLSPDQAKYWSDLFKMIFDSEDWKTYSRDNSLSGDFLSGDALRSYWLAGREQHGRLRAALELMKL